MARNVHRKSEPNPFVQRILGLNQGEGGYLLRRRCRSRRHGVDDLARPRVVQLLTSLMLDRIRIAFEPVHMRLQLRVLLLKIVHLHLEPMRLLTLLLISRQPVLAEDDVKAHRQRKQPSGKGRSLAPPHPLTPPRYHQRAARSERA